MTCSIEELKSKDIKWMNVQTNKWMHEWMFEQMNEWMYEWSNKWMNVWMFKQMNQAYPQEKLEDQLHWRTPLRKYQTWLVYEPVLLHSRPLWRPSWIVLIVRALFFFRRILNNKSFVSILFIIWQFVFVFQAQMLEMVRSASSNPSATAILNCPDAVMTVLPFDLSFGTPCLECPIIMITVPFFILLSWIIHAQKFQHIHVTWFYGSHLGMFHIHYHVYCTTSKNPCSHGESTYVTKWGVYKWGLYKCDIKGVFNV